MTNVPADPTRRTALVAGVLYLVTFLASIPAVFLLQPVLKREHEGFALGFVTTRMFEAAVIAVGVVSILAIVTLRQPGAPADEAAVLVPVGQALVAVRDWTFVLGPGMAGLNALLFGTLLYRSRLVPRAIPALGLIGGPIYLSSVIGIVLGLTVAGSPWQ